MNETASTRTDAYAQIRIREPAGERTLGAPLSIGGEGAQIVVPGSNAGAALQIERHEGVWTAEPMAGTAARFDGRPLRSPRDLRKGDVLTVGDAQVVVSDLTRTLLRLEVIHLVGNTTIAPVDALASLGAEAGDDTLEIVMPRLPEVVPAAASVEREAQPIAIRKSAGIPWKRWAGPAAAAVVLLAILGFITMLEPVVLDMRPSDASVDTPGTLVSLHVGDRVFVLPGQHTLRAEREGYRPAQASVTVRDGGNASATLRLERLPGRLQIDTGGIAATVSIDGVERGKAPGEIEIPAGRRTVTLRAPRYLDYTTDLDVVGGGEEQQLVARLQPAWGTLRITATPAEARVAIDGEDSGVVPVAAEALSGVRRIQISAPGYKTWESSVVVKAGETLDIGPITLGEPDARLNVRSTPNGAEVAIAGTYRGRTPLTVNVPAGTGHEIVVSAPGYASWTRTIRPEPGAPVTLEAQLEPVLGRVVVRGEPADAEIVIDGEVRGRTPSSLELRAVDHRIEIRKEGFHPYTATVTPQEGLERVVEYRLTSTNRAIALQESAPTIKTGTGYVLRIVPPGKFTMGSDRREQGRRPNEGERVVTLERPFYMGVTEVTNQQFRQYRQDHSSGIIGRRSIDLDAHPVTRVTWEEAAAFCNWMSERDGLPPAYEQQGNTYVLRQPVTTGYRLPTEAEWEYAARYAGPQRMNRFGWGEALPVASQAGNVAGAEAMEAQETVLDGYRDEYPIVAPVGKFSPNALGLHDMAGNVSEWVNDYYLSFVDSTPAVDPLGPSEGTRHVVRGANWRTGTVSELRLAWRDAAEEGSSTIGFRIARYAE